MWTKPTTTNAGGWLTRVGLACLASAALWAPATAQPLVGEAKTPQERVALAERQVAVKQAAVKIADAQKGVAEAKVIIAKASIQTTIAAVSRWDAEAKRTKQLHAQGVLDKATLDDVQLQLASAKASLVEAEGKLLLAEREVAVEEARRQLAQADLAEAQLRRDQLNGKLPPAPKKADAAPALLKARLDAAKKTYEDASKGMTEVRRMGNINVLAVKPEEVYTWSVRWLNAERDMSEKKDEHIAAVEAHLKRMKDLQKKVATLVPGILPPMETTAAEWYVAEAEVWLAKEKAK